LLSTQFLILDTSLALALYVAPLNPNRQYAGMRTADMEISDTTSEELEKRMDELAPKYAAIHA